MNFEFFFFLVFMSFVSFAIAFLAYAMVVRFMGKESSMSRMAQIILVPACIVFYDFIVFASEEYKYWVGSVPLLLIGLMLLYYRFFKGEALVPDNNLTPSQMANLAKEEKKFSKKSQRIHEARKKRGKE